MYNSFALSLCCQGKVTVLYVLFLYYATAFDDVYLYPLTGAYDWHDSFWVLFFHISSCNLGIA